MRETEDHAKHFARQLFEALRQGAWKVAATMYDHRELTRFRQVQLEEFLGRFRDEGKGDLAEYIADPFLLLPEIASRPVIGWPALGNVQQLVDLSPTAFFAKYLELAQEAFRDIAVTRSVAAVAIEGTELIHVLYRRDEDAVRKARRLVRFVGTPPSWAVSVLSIRRADMALTALPNYELNGDFFSKILAFLDRESNSSEV